MVLVLAIAGTSITMNTAQNLARENYLPTVVSALTLALQVWILPRMGVAT